MVRIAPAGVLALLSLLLLLVACGGEPDGEPGETRGKPVVYTTFYPTTYFAERIGGDLVRVVCPVPEDVDAIFWQPPDAAIAAYQGADLIVVNGAQFEKWILTTSLPESRVVDTAMPFAADFVKFEDAVEHSHGPAGAHAHEGIDGHTWLDPLNAKIQAGEILRALVRLLPDQEAPLTARFDALAKDLDGLHSDLARMTGAYRGEAIYTSHPAYNYLRKRYGWKIVNLDLDPGEMPSDEVFTSLQATLEKLPARHILWESTPTAEIAARFERELGLESVTFSPCELMGAAELDAGEDYLSVMRRNLASIEKVLTP